MLVILVRSLERATSCTASHAYVNFEFIFSTFHCILLIIILYNYQLYYRKDLSSTSTKCYEVSFIFYLSLLTLFIVIMDLSGFLNLLFKQTARSVYFNIRLCINGFCLNL